MFRRLAATDPAGLDWALNNLADSLAAVGRLDEARQIADEVENPAGQAELIPPSEWHECPPGGGVRGDRSVGRSRFPAGAAPDAAAPGTSRYRAPCVSRSKGRKPVSRPSPPC